MENFTTTYGYRASYKYRCRYDSDGKLVEKRFCRCIPRDGMRLYKVVGQEPMTALPPRAYRYFLGTSEEDAKQQYKIWFGWDAAYANVVVRQQEINRVLTRPHDVP